MIRKCHTHTPQTNSRHCEEETKNMTTTLHPEDNKSHETSPLFPSGIIAKLEGHKVLHNNDKDQKQNSRKQLGQP